MQTGLNEIFKGLELIVFSVPNKHDKTYNSKIYKARIPKTTKLKYRREKVFVQGATIDRETGMINLFFEGLYKVQLPLEDAIKRFFKRKTQ